MNPLAMTAVAFVVLFSWPWSEPDDAPSPLPGENGMHTSFGTISSELVERYGSQPVDWQARVNLTSGSTPDAAMFLFGFVPETRSLAIELTNITTASGVPIPIERDERAASPKVFVNASALPADEEIILQGQAAASRNGRHQVGSLVIAFDPDWEKVVTPQGDVAQLYAYGYVGASGVSAAGPPFEGRGNVGPLALVWLLVALPVGLVVAGAQVRGRGGVAVGRRPPPEEAPPPVAPARPSAPSRARSAPVAPIKPAPSRSPKPAAARTPSRAPAPTRTRTPARPAPHATQPAVPSIPPRRRA